MVRFLVLVASAAALAACTTKPILNVTDAPISMSARDANVAEIIESTALRRGWQVTARRPGAIDLSLLARQHRADVTISYDHDSYSITYRDSVMLDHNGEMIHRNYNRWVANLNADIQLALGKASLAPAEAAPAEAAPAEALAGPPETPAEAAPAEAPGEAAPSQQ